MEETYIKLSGVVVFAFSKLFTYFIIFHGQLTG